MSARRFVAVLLVLMVGAVAASAQTQTTGTWSTFGSAAASTTYKTSVQPPINSDDSSTFPGNKGVIPVKFTLSVGSGPLGISSIGTTYGAVAFTPSSTITLNTLTTLSATFTMGGSCGGGSPRFVLNYGTNQNIFVYLGPSPNFGPDCVTTGNFGSGFNLIAATDNRFDSTQIGGPFYDNLANLRQGSWGNVPIHAIYFVVDGGWATVAGQSLTVTNITVNDNIYMPGTGGFVPTCALPPATIQVQKTADSSIIPPDESSYVMPADNGSDFRISDCQYIYNLGAKNLDKGLYQINAVINSIVVDQKPAKFGIK